MFIRFFSCLMVIAVLSVCAPLVKNPPIMPEETTEGLSGDEVSALDEVPDASNFNPCNTVLPNGEFVALYMMSTDPEYVFNRDCKMLGAECTPPPTNKDWPYYVRKRLKEDGCNDGLISQKLPKIFEQPLPHWHL